MYESMFTPPASLFDHFDRLRRELDGAFGATSPLNNIRSVAHGTLPAINIGRTPTSVEVYAFAPGLDMSKTEVTVDRGVLRLAGERPAAVPAQDEAQARVQAYTRERRTGRFVRAVSLPDDIDPAQAKATYRDGVLQISIPLREAARPQRITVQ